jgi:AraC-like DNA-binding protein
MLLNLFYVFSGLLGLISFFIIVVQFKYNRLLNIYLLLSFKLLAMNFLFIGLGGFDLFTISKKVYYIFYPFLIVIIPAMYLYFLNMNKNNQSFDFKQLKHFIFPIVLVSLNIIIKLFFSSTVPLFYTKLVFSVLFILYILYYGIHSFFFIKKTLLNKENEIINIKQNKVQKKWTYFMFMIYCLLIIHLIIIILINLKSKDNHTLDNYKYIPAFILNIMYFKILFTPEILYGYNVMYKKLKEYNNSNFILKDIWILTPSEKITNIQDQALSKKISEYTSNYIHDIEKLVFQHEILRNPTITLNEISIKLKMPKSHLIFVFKYLSKVNFTEFKKIIRTYDAIQLIEKDYLKSNTLESLAIKVGFSSYSPFYTTFKEITGVSPQSYTKENVLNIKN